MNSAVNVLHDSIAHEVLVIPFDGYNMVLPPPQRWDVIGTVRPTFSRTCFNGWKIIEVYEDIRSGVAPKAK